MIRKSMLLWLLATLVLAGAGGANAENLVSQTGLINGRQSFVVPLQIDSPGTLTVTLTDLNWLARLSDLSFSLAGKAGLVSAAPPAGTSGSATQMFVLTQPGAYYGYVSGTGGGSYGLGLYSLNAEFTASSALPLPAAGWLLLGALGSLLALARRRWPIHWPMRWPMRWPMPAGAMS